MAFFDFDRWWNENVDPELSILDQMYKEITKDAIDAALKFYNLKVEQAERMEKEAIDLDDIDLSDVLGKK
jgi:hypothetical protein